MLIFDENTEAIILENIHTPTITDYFWVLDLNIMDYMLAPLLVLTQIDCPAIIVKIGGFEFPLPPMWNILAYSEETYEIDAVEIQDLAGKQFVSMVYGQNTPNVIPGVVTVVDYIPDYRHVAPILNKHQMLCHPISPSEWVNVSPSDGYNKYLKNRTVGDIIG